MNFRLRAVSFTSDLVRGVHASVERRRREKQERQPLSRLAPSVTRVVICVSRAFCSTDQEKRESAPSLSHFRRLVSRRLFLCYNESTNGRFSYFLAPVVPELHSAIHRINLYSVDNAIGFPNAY